MTIRFIPRGIGEKARNVLRYWYVLDRKRHPVSVQKICFFYLPEVPDFGSEFTYFKLGKREDVINRRNHQVIYEADLADNLSTYNKHFLDYSGLYALHKNHMISSEYMLLIHYDTQILNKNWINIIEGRVRRGSVVFSTWPLDKERSDISRWIYERIDKIFLASHGRTFLSYLKEYGLDELPNSSQFACDAVTFKKLMTFLMPLYELILAQPEQSYKYAHLLERAWGLFFAMSGYKKEAVIRDSHNQCKSGLYNLNSIDIPIMTVAIERKVESFSEILR